MSSYFMAIVPGEPGSFALSLGHAFSSVCSRRELLLPEDLLNAFLWAGYHFCH